MLKSTVYGSPVKGFHRLFTGEDKISKDQVVQVTVGPKRLMMRARHRERAQKDAAGLLRDCNSLPLPLQRRQQDLTPSVDTHRAKTVHVANRLSLVA